MWFFIVVVFFPFLNWVAWTYAAVASRRPRFALFALLYGVPWFLTMTLAATHGDFWPFKVSVTLTWILWLAGIIHAFWIRGELAVYIQHARNLRQARLDQLADKLSQSVSNPSTEN